MSSRPRTRSSLGALVAAVLALAHATPASASRPVQTFDRVRAIETVVHARSVVRGGGARGGQSGGSARTGHRDAPAQNPAARRSAPGPGTSITTSAPGRRSAPDFRAVLPATFRNGGDGGRMRLAV